MRKTATAAVKSVKTSVKGAVAAVRRVAKRAVKQVSNMQPMEKVALKAAAAKPPSSRP